MAKRRIIYVASNTYIENEPFIPVILAFAHQGAEVRIVAQTVFAFNTVNVGWNRYISKFAGIVCFEPGDKHILKRSLATKARIAFRMAIFLLDVILKRYDAVFVSARFPTDRFFRFIGLFRNVWYYRGGALFNKKEKLQFSGKNLTREQRRAMGKADIPDKKRKKVRVDRAVFLSRELLENEEVIEPNRSLILPFPHMQGWWKNFLKDNPPAYSSGKANEAEEFITVIPLRKGNYYFAKGSDVDTLLDEIIGAVRKYYPKTLIVIKAKFEWFRFWLDEDGLRRRYNDENIVLSYDSVITLSEKTLFAVSTCQTTACHFMLSAGVPVIEYGRYSQLWRSIFPKLTSIEDYGGIFIQDKEVLAERIRAISKKRVDVNSLKLKIDYKDTELNLEYFGAEP